jgi:hypothetical protein
MIAPALLGQRAPTRSPGLSCLAPPIWPEPRMGPGFQVASLDGVTLRPQRPRCMRIAYDMEYVSHLVSRCTLIGTQ